MEKCHEKWSVWTKIQNKMYLWVLFGSGVQRTLYRTPKDPQFANVGVVVVYHKIEGKKRKKMKFF